MLYLISINQRAFVSLGSKAGLEEGALMAYIYWLCSSPNSDVERSRVTYEGHRYTWFDYGHFISENPMLQVSSKSTVVPRIKLLESEGFIHTVQDRKTGRKYVRLLPRVDGLFLSDASPVRKNEQARSEKRTGPFGNQNIDKYTNDKNTTDKKDLAAGSAWADIKAVFDAFEPINPAYATFFKNKTEQDAARSLLRLYGKEKLLAFLATLPEIIARPYAPKLTTPYRLFTGLGVLKAFIQQEQKKGHSLNVVTIS